MNRFILAFGFAILLSGISRSETTGESHTLAYLSPQDSAQLFSPPTIFPSPSRQQALAPAMMPGIPEVSPITPSVPPESMPAALLGTIGMIFLLCRHRSDHA